MRKPLLYYFVFKQKQVCCENNFYRGFIIVKGITASWSPLLNICYSSFLWTFIHVTRFQSVSIFNGFISLVIIILLHAFLNLHLWLILIRFLVSTLFVCALQMLRWLMFWILQAVLTCKDNFILFIFYVWPAGRYLWMFCISQYVVCIRSVINRTLLHLCIPTR